MALKAGTLCAAVAALATFGLLYHQTEVFNLQASSNDRSGDSMVSASKPFSWADVPAYTTLKWQSCYENRDCARLLVPMNYSEPEGEKYNLALIRKPALLPPDSEFYRGPVLFNPGGPGGSGVDTIHGPRGDQFSALLGPQFDIVGFDPRGISRSTPRATFFPSDVERELWDSVTSSSNTSDVARVWARSRVLTQLAGELDTGYLRHLSTENTARDMMSIVKAHGQNKIQYWGFSYGTVLGAVFASLFPDNIERLVIDGVVDMEDYFSAGERSSTILDTEIAMDKFYSGCADAGPDGCPFWAPTAENIHKNLTRLIDSVRTNPIPIRTKSGYGLLDFNMLHLAIFSSLYAPYALFPALANDLADLASGSGESLFARMSNPKYECECDAPGRYPTELRLEAQIALTCNDALEVPGDLRSTQAHFDRLRKVSARWGDEYATIRTQCVGWPKFPKTHFRGPFVANTSHPILLIGNTADPVTPLWAAKKLSKGFKNSIVLTQNSVGHGSVSAPSLCTQKHIREYFIDGTLPPPETICQPQSQPFPTTMKTSEIKDQALISSGLSEDDIGILKAVMDLSKDTAIVPFFSGGKRF